MSTFIQHQIDVLSTIQSIYALLALANLSLLWPDAILLLAHQ